MLKPSDLTKAELLQVVEMLVLEAGQYWLDLAVVRIEMQRNDAHIEKSKKLIEEEQQHYDNYFEILRPYDGDPLGNIPVDVVIQAQSELAKALAAGKEWNRLNKIRLKGKTEENP